MASAPRSKKNKKAVPKKPSTTTALAPRPPGPKVIYTDENIAEALHRNLGVIARAAEELGCGRRTIERRMAHNEELREIVREHLERTKDFAEVAIRDKMLKGDTTMLIFFAKTKMKDRGYIERVEQDIVFQGQMQVQHGEAPVLDLTKLSEEELNILNGLLTKAGHQEVG